ncbi:hypothetical protein [Myroides odoratimimus]|uniref:hypothetical protein n=1 Tax=Myroides odoratimimus TaxID=76832 RepID=UPI0025778AA0|nr:hypothetical protein [Myroides odoratimimus]
MTLENVISFLNTDTSRQEKVITENSDIAYNFGYGLDIDDLLISLEDEFGVSFDYFEFARYFYHERNINTLMCLVLFFGLFIYAFKRLFGIKEQYQPDPNKEVCTPVTLYVDMFENKKIE